MRKGNIADAVLLCLKILLPILMGAPLLYFSYGLVENRLSDVAHRGEVSYHSGLGLYFFLSAMVLLCVNLLCLVLGILGWVIAHRHRATPRRQRNLITLRALTFAPILCLILYGWILLLVHLLIR